MSATSPTPAPDGPPGPPAPPLSLVARRLEAAAHEAGWGATPLLVGFSGGPADPLADRQELPPVEGSTHDPVADLLGYEVPRHCSALAVVTEGDGRRLADGLDSTDPAESPVVHRLAYVLDRRGRAGLAIRARGGRVTVDTFEHGAADGPSGRLVDVCHRALDLPTAAPPPDTARLWLASWLDLLLARALGRSRALTWADAVRLHPAVSVLDRVEHRLLADPEVDGAGVGRMTVALGRAVSWEELRRATADEAWAPHGLTPEQAAWMDAGMYARWVTGEFLPGQVYLRELNDLLAPEVARLIDGVAAAVADRLH